MNNLLGYISLNYFPRDVCPSYQGTWVLLGASVCVYPLLVHFRDCFETRFIQLLFITVVVYIL